MRVAECLIIQDLDAPRKCHSFPLQYRRIRGEKVDVIGFFSPGKLYRGRYFNIFHRTVVVYLYYNCHQDPYPPPIQRAADVLCVVLFFHEDVTCIVNDGSLCLPRLDLKVGGKRNSSEQSCYWSCHTGTL